MSSSDFRQIAARNETGRSERLFRAAVSAFCSLTRPTRREISQLEDLVLPLFDCVSKDSLRYVAAALSESDFGPRGLVGRLADEPVDVAAPLLLRSKALSDVDLIALIGRHGLPHARAIARRQDLNPVIEDLIRALITSAAREGAAAPAAAVTQRPEDLAIEPQEVADLRAIFAAHDADQEAQHIVEHQERFAMIANDPLPETAAPQKTFGKADAVREQLRAMMLPAGKPEEFNAVLELAPVLSPAELSRLRETALTGKSAFFETALADALGIDYAQARTICGATGYNDLLHALKSLEVAEDTAFVITAANYPSAFGHAEAIRLFLERYRLCHPGAAREKIRGWKAEAIATTVRRAKPKPVRLPEIANTDERESLLRAS